MPEADPHPHQGPRAGRRGADPRVRGAAPGPHPLRLRGRVPAPVEGRAGEGSQRRGGSDAMPRRCGGRRVGGPAAPARQGRAVRPGARALARGRVRRAGRPDRGAADRVHGAQRVGAVPPRDVLEQHAHVRPQPARLRRLGPRAGLDPLPGCDGPLRQSRWPRRCTTASTTPRSQTWAGRNGVREELQHRARCPGRRHRRELQVA